MSEMLSAVSPFTVTEGFPYYLLSTLHLPRQIIVFLILTNNFSSKLSTRCSNYFNKPRLRLSIVADERVQSSLHFDCFLMESLPDNLIPKIKCVYSIFTIKQIFSYSEPRIKLFPASAVGIFRKKWHKY